MYPIVSANVMLVLLGFLYPLAIPDAVAQRAGQAPAVFDGLETDERLGEYVPMDLLFFNEDGQEVELGRYFEGSKPVLLNLVYHNCPMLCNLLLDGLNTSLRELAWVPGDQFEVVTVSFAADETPEMARRQKEKYIRELGKPEAGRGWHFLTGTEASIKALADAVGFNFRWVEEQKEYAHPAALMFASGSGKLTRYLYGLQYPPRDIRNALVEASEGTIGTPLDQAILFCFRFDANANSYVPHAINLMKAASVLTVLVLGLFLAFFWRRERRQIDGAALAGQPGRVQR